MKPSRSFLVTFCATAVALAGISPRPAAAQTIVGNLEVPGGLSALRRAAGLEDGPLQTTMVDIVRLQASLPDAGTESAKNLHRYFTFIEELRTLQREWPDGIRLPTASTPERVREACREALWTLTLELERDRGLWRAVETEPSARNEQWRVRRHQLLTFLKLDPVQLAGQLNRVGHAALPLTIDAVPLPAPAFWGGFVQPSGRFALETFFGDRRTPALYLGMLGLDSSTLGFLASQPEILRRIHAESAVTFAAFGSRVRIRNARIELPGGSRALDVWRRLVGQDPQDLTRFLPALFQRDQGRLAWFFASLDDLEPNRQALVFGSPASPLFPSAIDSAYRVFAKFFPDWRVDRAPMAPGGMDPAMALSLVEVSAEGTVGPDWWPEVFRRVSSSPPWPMLERRPEAGISARGKADGVWLLEWAFEKREDAAARVGWIRFAQRRLQAESTLTQTALQDFELALLALRNLPALIHALDRMGVTDPSLYGFVARSAQRLTGDEASRGVPRSMAQWQAALGLLEQLTKYRKLSADRINHLVESLATRIPRFAGGDPALAGRTTLDGAVADWVFDALIPEWCDTVCSIRGSELEILPLLYRDLRAQSPVLSDGERRFRSDPAASRLRWLARTRGTASLRLEHLAVLRNARQDLVTQSVTQEQLGALVENLKAVHRLAVQATNKEDDDAAAWVALGEAIGLVDAAKERWTPGLGPEFAPRLVPAVDALAARVLPAVLYALTVPPTRSGLLSPWMDSLVPRHHFRLEPFGEFVPNAAWIFPALINARGSVTVRGAMTGMDLALARGVLANPARTAASEWDPFVDDTPERRAVASAVELFRVDPNRRQPGAHVGSAVDRGLDRIKAWLVEGAPDTLELDIRSAIGVGWRASTILWLGKRKSATKGDEIKELLLPVDLLRLGGNRDLPAAWGAAGMPVDGCWCPLVLPRTWSRDWLTDPASADAVSRRTTDVQLALSWGLTDRGLPAELVDSLMPLALGELAVPRPLAFDWKASFGVWPLLGRFDPWLSQLIASDRVPVSQSSKEDE